MPPIKPTFQVAAFRFRYADPQDAGSMIADLLRTTGPSSSTLRFAVQERTKTLVVRGTGEELDLVRNLIEVVDVPVDASKPAESKLVVYPIPLGVSVNAASESMLKQWARGRRLDVVVDDDANRILVSGSPVDQKLFQEAFDRIAAKSTPRTTWRLHVKVLSDSWQTASEGQELEPSLAKATAQLGMKGARIVGGLTLQAFDNPGTYFEGLTSLPQAGGGTLTVEGTWSDSTIGDGVRLQFAVTELADTSKPQSTETVTETLSLTADVIPKPGRTTLVGGASTPTGRLAFAVTWEAVDG
ncbi:MAG: secretin N-terminal domain-containing protein [Planctomycetota bacterium]